MNSSKVPRRNNKLIKAQHKKSLEIIPLPQIDTKRQRKQIEKQQSIQDGMLTKLMGFFSGWFGSNQSKPQQNKKPEANDQTESKQQNQNKKQKVYSPQKNLKNIHQVKPHKNIPIKRQISPQSKQKMMRLEEVIQKKLFAIQPNKIYPKNTSNPYDIKLTKGASDLPFLSDRFANVQKVVSLKYKGPANRLDVNAQILASTNKNIFKEPSYYSQQRGLNKLPYTLSYPTKKQQQNRATKTNQIYSRAKKSAVHTEIKGINRDVLDLINTDLTNSYHLRQAQQLLKLGQFNSSSNKYNFNTISEGEYQGSNQKKNKYLLKHSRQMYNSNINQSSYVKNMQDPMTSIFEQRKAILKSTPKYSRSHINQ